MLLDSIFSSKFAFLCPTSHSVIYLPSSTLFQNSPYATVHVMPLRIDVNSVNSTTTTTFNLMMLFSLWDFPPTIDHVCRKLAYLLKFLVILTSVADTCIFIYVYIYILIIYIIYTYKYIYIYIYVCVYNVLDLAWSVTMLAMCFVQFSFCIKILYQTQNISKVWPTLLYYVSEF